MSSARVAGRDPALKINDKANYEGGFSGSSTLGILEV